MSRKSENKARRPGERSASVGGGVATGKIVLLGSVVLLVGIGAMIALRANQLGGNAEDDPDIASADPAVNPDEPNGDTKPPSPGTKESATNGS